MSSQRVPIWLGFSIVVSCLLAGLVPAANRSFHCTLGLGGNVLAEAEMQLSEDGSALLYTLEVYRIRDITMAHLHLGKPGTLGTPVVWLYPSSPPPELIPGPFEGVLARGKITENELIGPLRGKPLSSLIEEIQAGNVYVNVHTRDHATGDICGPVALAGP